MGDTDVQDIEVEVEIDVPVTELDSSPSAQAENQDGKNNKKREQKDPEPCEAPDSEAYKQAQEKIKAELAVIQKQIDEITAKIDAACEKRQKYRDEIKAAQDQLTASTDQRKSNAELIDVAKQQYISIAEARKQQREILDPLKQGLKFSTRAALEEAILKIEARLASANLAPAFRSKYTNDINLLKSQRIQTMRYEEQLTLVKLALVDPDPLREDREAKFNHNRALLADSDAAHAKKLAAKAEAAKWNKDIEEHIAKRKLILEEKRKAQNRQNDLGRKFRDQERAFERYQSFLDYKKRQAAREKRAAEKAERAEKAAARAAERAKEGEQTPENWSGDGVYKGKQAADTTIQRNTYETELGVIADLRRYLEFYKPKEVGKESGKESSQTPTPAVTQPRREFNEKKTVSLLQKKNEIDDEWGSVIGTSKPSKPSREAPKVKKVKDAPMSFIPQVLEKFKSIDVDPPLLTSRVEAVLKILDEKQKYYTELPDKELEQEEQKKQEQTQLATKPARELEEGEIEDDEEEQPSKVTEAVDLANAVDDLTTTLAAVSIHHVGEAVAEVAEEGEEELTPEQAAAMAAMNEELGFVVDEAQAGLGGWAPTKEAEKAEKKDETTEKKTETNNGASAEEEEEELTPEQAAAMAAMNEELGFVVDEAQAGLGDWAPTKEAEKAEKKDEKPVTEALTTIAQEAQLVVTKAVSEAVDASQAAEEEEVEVIEYEEVEIEEGDEGEEGDEEVEAAQ